MKGHLDRYFKSNIKHWNDAASVHLESEYYNVDEFLGGTSSLSSVEVAEVGEVAGKSLLHLQCHIGLDSLSWARKGADVVGVDFSDESIRIANELALKSGLQGKVSFIDANIYELHKCLSQKFDIVFTSHGVLNWLPDIQLWAKQISSFMKSNAMFYIVDIHPYTWIFDDNQLEGLYPKHSYFGSRSPVVWTTDGTYAVRTSKVKNKETFLWQHTLGEVVSALAGSGLRIEFVHEFPFCSYQIWPFLIKAKSGFWSLPDSHQQLPLLFSIRAWKTS